MLMIMLCGKRRKQYTQEQSRRLLLCVHHTSKSSEAEHGVPAEHDGQIDSSSQQIKQRVLRAARPTQKKEQGRTHRAARIRGAKSFMRGGGHVDDVVEQ